MVGDPHLVVGVPALDPRRERLVAIDVVAETAGDGGHHVAGGVDALPLVAADLPAQFAHVGAPSRPNLTPIYTPGAYNENAIKVSVP
jgi:hypothetical protein